MTFRTLQDLYVYFYELGVRMLKPVGLLCFIVTNKWMKAGYGKPLRRFFSEKAWGRSVVDFGPLYIIFPGCRISLGSAFSFASRWPHCC
jgi:hypothetical protein